MDVSTFRTQFPEFLQTDVTLLSAMLNAALQQLDPTVWLAKLDQGQAYLAAHMLALSVFGNNARLAPPNEDKTVYWGHFTRLRAQVAGTPRVI